MKLSPFVCLLIMSCSSSVPAIDVTISKSTNFDYDDVSTSIEFDQTFLQNEEQYLVYFYSVTCGHCEALKQEIISYYLTSDNITYFVDCTNKDVYGKKKDLIGICDINDFYIFGTPFLIHIISGVISEYYYGINQIRDYITSKISINEIE